MVHACLNCLRGEFADEDSEGIAYVAKPGATVAHVERPSGSWGTGGALAVMVRSARGRQTYCGHPVSDDWVAVAEADLR